MIIEPKRWLVALALAMCFVCGAARATGCRVSLEELIKKNPKVAVSYIYGLGSQSLARSDYADAQEKFSYVLLKLDSLHAPSNFSLARIFIDSGKHAQAMPYSRKAYELDTANINYLSQYAAVTLYGEKVGQADTLFAELRRRDPSLPQGYVAGAMIAQQRGNPRRAVELVDEFGKNFGDDPQLLEIKQDALIRMRDYYGSLHFMEELVGRYPDEPEFRVSLAEVRATLGQDSLALVDYKAAISLDTTAWRGYVALSEYYRLNANIPQYINTLMHVFKSDGLPAQGKAEYFSRSFFDPALYPKYYFDIDRLAMALYAKHPTAREVVDVYCRFLMYVGRLDEAQTFYLDKVKQKSADVEDFRSLFSILMHRNRFDSLSKVVNVAIERFPKQQDFRLMPAYVMMNRGAKEPDVIGYLQSAKRHFVDDSMMATLLILEGDLYQSSGQIKSAAKTYEKAIKLSPKDAGLLNNYAYMLSVLGRDLERALAMSELANELVASNSTYLDTQAWVLYRLGRYEQSRVVMRKALALESDPISSVLYIHYADILTALGDTLMAKNYYRKALEVGHDGKEIEERLLKLEQQSVQNK